MTEFFDFTMESQQAAQSYVAFPWKFRMGGNAFTVIDLLKEWGSEEERVYPFRSIYEMESIAPTLYEPISNLKSFAVLRNQEGELLDVYWDECDPLERKAEAKLSDSDKHNLVFFLTFSILQLFPIYHETTFLSGYTKFNSRIRSLYERLESALVAAYPQCYDVHLSSDVTKLFIAQLIDLNKHPFFKKDKVYNLNHLIKELRKR